jgi:hypothetical protein
VNVIRGGFDADLETIRPAITSGAEAIVSTAGPIPGNNGTGTVGPNKASIILRLEACTVRLRANVTLSQSRTSTKSSLSLQSRSLRARSAGC